MLTKPQWQVDYGTWVAAWRVEHPVPPMSRKARWKIEHAAWLEMRAEAKRRLTTDATAPIGGTDVANVLRRRTQGSG